jgi:hypothetical protein
MKSTSRVLTVGIALLVASMPLAAASLNPEIELSSQLSGIFRGSTPGNDLSLTIRSVTTDPSHLYDLYVQASGKYQGTNIRQQGLIRLEPQGKSVYFGYIPHFDPTVSSMSANAARFSDEEANAACGLVMEPKGDGFYGETVGSTCARAIRGALGKWSFEVELGSIRIRNVASGETLRFKRVEK